MRTKQKIKKRDLWFTISMSLFFVGCSAEKFSSNALHSSTTSEGPHLPVKPASFIGSEIALIPVCGTVGVTETVDQTIALELRVFDASGTLACQGSTDIRTMMRKENRVVIPDSCALKDASIYRLKVAPPAASAESSVVGTIEIAKLMPPHQTPQAGDFKPDIAFSVSDGQVKSHESEAKRQAYALYRIGHVTGGFFCSLPPQAPTPVPTPDPAVPEAGPVDNGSGNNGGDGGGGSGGSGGEGC